MEPEAHSLNSDAMPSRLSVIKFKINGECVNRCAFCMFNSNPAKLEVDDLRRFFLMAKVVNGRKIVINGGEPTIHPRFEAITDYLAEEVKPMAKLYLGTNLIPLYKKRSLYARIWKKILRTYDALSVGCDDEHKNIVPLECLAPEIVQSGRGILINVMKDYCDRATADRILALAQKYPTIEVTWSDVSHFYAGRKVLNVPATDCKRRLAKLLINCNGDAFFCLHQEFEQPVFNLFAVDEHDLEYFLNTYQPAEYRFCPYCERYVAQATEQR